MARFTLLLRGNPADWTSLSPDDMQRIMERYMTWDNELRSHGIEVSSEQLDETSSVQLTSADHDSPVIDGPYTETRESIGGLYIISAADRDEAIQIARDCPVFLHGGTVEIVRVVEDSEYGE
ncbi:MAG TPA: YciI family protein [Thermomicrobiales bacterium]|jgi:hypothetical protein|nr:YciI family protein [Thermomicrobiales bacterium]